MEKKTIGKFIAELRRANGMTQKELAEELYISDKTVSRWERDECTPDINLLPAIADLFGVTCNELIQGERIPAPLSRRYSKNEDTQREKDEKRLSQIFNIRYVKYQNLSMITIGISLFGLIVAIICNFVFYRGILGFALASSCAIAAIICQACFSNSTIYRQDKELSSVVMQHNINTVSYARKIVTHTLLVFSSTFPFAFVGSGFVGLNFIPWIFYALISVFATYLLLQSIYLCFVEKVLIEKGLVVISEKTKLFRQQRNHLFKRCGIPCLSVATVFLIGLLILQECFNVFHFTTPVIFDNYEDFQTYMEQTLEPDGTLYDPAKYEDDHIVFPTSVFNFEYDVYTPLPHDAKLYNGRGETVLEYRWNNLTVSKVVAAETEDGLPVKVYTQEAINDGYVIRDTLTITFFISSIAPLIVFAVLYTVKIRPLRKEE